MRLRVSNPVENQKRCECDRPRYRYGTHKFQKNSKQYHGIKVSCIRCGRLCFWTNRRGARRLKGEIAMQEL